MRIGLAFVVGVTLIPAAVVPAAAVDPPADQRCSAPSPTISHTVPWTHERLAPQRVWPLTNGAGVIVAVIDTGVDAAVPQLAGHVLAGVDVVNGGGTANQDCYGHGTFVAGLIAAQPLPGSGVVGIAPGVQILPIRQANNVNDGSAATLAASIRAAVRGGAKVINISASSFVPSADVRAAVVEATAADVLLVASAANAAQSGNPIAYPAAYPEVIAVGAIGPDGARSDFSEVGDYLDLVAPGTDVVSLSRGGNGHLMDSGTSYATAFVTGVAALVRAYHPRLRAAQVKHRIEQTADHPGTALPDPKMGWGAVNPYNAVTAVLPEEASIAAGRAAPAPAITIVTPAAPDTTQRDAALDFALRAVAVTAVGGLLAYLIPRGVRRRWHSVDDELKPKAGENK